VPHVANGREKLLIVNADGYGFTAGVNRGIEEAIESGIVTSISVNANFETVSPLRELAARHPRLSVGVHLNPVAGSPIADPADVPTLVNDRGEFHFDQFTPRLQSEKIDRAELKHELRLQIERVKELVPVVTHLDSHQNRHLWPRFFEIFLELAREQRIDRMRTHASRIGMEYEQRFPHVLAFYAAHPRRLATHGFARYLMWRARRRGMRMCRRLLSVGAAGTSSGKGMLEVWLQIARGCPRGTNEIYCHPAYVDDDLRRWAKVIVEQREHERRVLTDPRLRKELDRNGVRLISFHEI
jgi:chitin disaccharide deacetylase